MDTVYLLPGWGAYYQRSLPHMEAPFLVAAAVADAFDGGGSGRFKAVRIHDQLTLLWAPDHDFIPTAPPPPWLEAALDNRTAVITSAMWALAQHMAAQGVAPPLISRACWLPY